MNKSPNQNLFTAKYLFISLKPEKGTTFGRSLASPYRPEKAGAHPEGVPPPRALKKSHHAAKAELPTSLLTFLSLSESIQLFLSTNFSQILHW